MDENRRKILELLAQGKVSVADAERLLEKIARLDPADTDDGEDEAAPAGSAKGAPKFLRVVVQDVTGENINVRVPLALVKTGVRLSALLPREAREAVEEQGVDLNGLSALKGNELAHALADLEVDARDITGSSVRVFCE